MKDQEIFRAKTSYLHTWKDHCCYGDTMIGAFRSGALVKVDTISEWYLYNCFYVINRTLHGRLKIRNFSSRVEIYLPRSQH